MKINDNKNLIEIAYSKKLCDSEMVWSERLKGRQNDGETLHSIY